VGDKAGRSSRRKADKAAEDAKAEDVIPGGLKRSASYHNDYGSKTVRQIRKLVAKGDPKARQMKKLIDQARRLTEKMREHRP